MKNTTMAKHVKEFIRIKRGNRKLVLQVMQYDWVHPHEAEIKWVTGKTVETAIGLDELDIEVKQLLQNPKYFGRCSQCRTVQVSGLMHSETHCQSCAQKHLGVVY